MTFADNRIRFIVQWLPAILGFVATFLSLLSEIGYVTTSLLSAVVAMFLWVTSNRVVGKASPQPTTVPPPKDPTPTFPMPSTQTLIEPIFHSVCEVGPYEVEAGEVRSIELKAKQGQRVKGHLKEVDKQPFDWYIADEKNMILIENGQRDDFTCIEAGYDEKAYRVNRKIPYPARWYLILDTYGKQYSRKVRVDFEPVGSI